MVRGATKRDSDTGSGVCAGPGEGVVMEPWVEEAQPVKSEDHTEPVPGGFACTMPDWVG